MKVTKDGSYEDTKKPYSHPIVYKDSRIYPKSRQKELVVKIGEKQQLSEGSYYRIILRAYTTVRQKRESNTYLVEI